jgi:hypothetical protein
MFFFPEQPIVIYEEEIESDINEIPLFKKAVEWMELNYDNIKDISDYLYKIEARGIFEHNGIHIVNECTYTNKYTINIIINPKAYTYKIFDITTKTTLINGEKAYTGTERNITHYNQVLRGEARGKPELIQPEMIKIDAHIRGVIASLKQHMET